jgi:hypothetical protein
MHLAGVPFFPCDSNLQAAVDQVRQRLAKRSPHPTMKDAAGKPLLNVPGVRFFRTCETSISTIPSLAADKSDPELPDKKSTSKTAYLALAFACMSRPIVPKQERTSEERLLHVEPVKKATSRIGSHANYPGAF